MPRIHKSLVGQVSAATPNNVTTTDGCTHMFKRWYAKMNVKENTREALHAAIDELIDFAIAVNKGDKVEVMNDEGKVQKVLVPTDATPKSKAEKSEIKDKSGKVTATIVNHGANMAKSLPMSYVDLGNAFNVGVQNLIGRDARGAVVEEYRQGGAKRGRGAAEVDFDEAN